MPTRDPQKIVNRLAIVTALQWTGSTMGLPLLALYLTHRGLATAWVGVVLASFAGAGVASQFLLGHAADRFGRRIVLIGGLIAYAVGSLSFTLPIPVGFFIVGRALQGAGAGAEQVAAMSVVADLVPSDQLGKSTAKIYSAQLFGVVFGPLLGSLTSLANLPWAFAAAGLLSCVAALSVVGINIPHIVHDEPLPPLRVNRQVAGSTIAAAVLGFVTGAYESCWSLLMHAHHASLFQIRLSWTMFGVPWLLLSPVGGKWADRYDRRVIVVFGLFNACLFIATYPWIRNPWIMISVGALEAVTAALSAPSSASLLADGAEPREQGRRQGLVSTASTAALGIGSMCAAPLFAIAQWLPFTAVAILGALATVSIPFVWRNVTGRATSSTP